MQHAMSSTALSIMNLPDEILLCILGSMNLRDLINTGRVNQRLNAVSQDNTLLRLHPHQIIKDRPYLNEKVYSFKTEPSPSPSPLLVEVFRNNTVNLDWLIHSATKIIRESKLTSVGWMMLNFVSIVAIRGAAVDAISNNNDPTVKSTCKSSSWWRAGTTVWNARPYGGALKAAIKPIREATRDQSVKADEVIRYLSLMPELDPVDIGARAYHIAECLMLLKIDKSLLDKIQDIVKERRLDNISWQVPTDVPGRGLGPGLRDWIRQFNELS